MAYWVITNRGFEGDLCRCSNCGSMWNTLFKDVSYYDECPYCHAKMDEENECVVEEKEEREEEKEPNVIKLNDLLHTFIYKQPLRIAVDGTYICDTWSDSEVLTLYLDYTVVLTEIRYEMRDNQVYVFCYVLLTKED